MEFLLNPNIAYLLIVTAFLLTLVAIVIPGTGIPEVLLAICLVLAGYLVYNLGINIWAAVLLAASIIPFLLAIRSKTWRIPLLIVTMLLLIGGSVFLFTGKNGFPLVDPLLAVIVSLISGGLVWVAADRTSAAMQRAPVHNPEALIGKIGEARTDIHQEGSVQLDGELWSARSETPITARSSVRVIRRDGLILTVEEESKSVI
jgi:membrane-bound serine protease (ClpP class)